MMNLEPVLQMLDEKERSQLFAILMEREDELVMSRQTAELLLDDLQRHRIERELLETNEILALGLSEEESEDMRKYHRGLTRALNAEGTFGKLARRYICEEIAKFEREKIA